MMSDPWFESPLGRRVLCAERRVAGRLLQRAFGHYLVQYGQWGAPDSFIAQARTRHCVLAELPGQPVRPDLWAWPERLPFASDSVDVLVLPHTLETLAEPHELLREAERVLVGEGRLLILGFNPWGICAVRRFLGRRRFPWNGHLVGERRLRDWLALLGMDVLTSEAYFFRPPSAAAGLGQHLPYFACGYAVLACKRLFGVNPLRAEPARPQRVPGSLARPATRNSHALVGGEEIADG